MHQLVNGFKPGETYGKEHKDRQASTAEKEKIEKSSEIGQYFRTNQPFEQNSKRRIGQYEGEGEPPMKK
jgi:hypothetical protein